MAAAGAETARGAATRCETRGRRGIRRQGPWRTVEQVELATLEWVWWWNNVRLHGELDYRTPAEIEAEHYADHESPRLAPASHGKP